MERKKSLQPRAILILRLLLIIEAFVLLGTAIALRRDYQDSWILEGLEIPFVVFMFTYAIYVFKESSAGWTVAYSILFNLITALLPGIKYVWSQGVAIDQHFHYELARSIFQEKHIPLGRTYSDTPFMHLSIAIFSMITNASLLDSFKFLPALYWVSYPLVIYAFFRKIASSESLPKYALLLSSMPVKATASFEVVGATFGTLLTILFLTQFTKLVEKRNRQQLLLVVTFLLTLVATHSYSSLMLLLMLSLTFLLVLPSLRVFQRRFTGFKVNIDTTACKKIVLVALVANVAWLSLKATDLLKSLTKLIVAYLSKMSGVVQPTKDVIPQRLFDVNIMGTLRVLFVYYGADLALMIMTAIGILITIKTSRSRPQKALLVLSAYTISLWVALATQILSGFGGLEYDRIIQLLVAVSPIFVAITLFHLESRYTRKIRILVPLIMLLAMTELYAYQPLIPSINVRSDGTAAAEPLVYVNNVNSIYQRYMIGHAERYIRTGRIACDRVTLNQIIGLTSFNFSRELPIWYYPDAKSLQDNATQKKYDYFLIHLPGKSGVFNEKYEIRDKSSILEDIYHSSVLYSNGESYILGKPLKISNHTG